MKKQKNCSGCGIPIMHCDCHNYFINSRDFDILFQLQREGKTNIPSGIKNKIISIKKINNVNIKNYISSISNDNIRQNLDNYNNYLDEVEIDIQKQAEQAIDKHIESQAEQVIDKDIESKTEPDIDKYLESQAEQAIDRYIESQTEPDIDKYLESQQQQAVDRYIESQTEPDIDKYLESQQQQAVDRYIESQTEPDIDKYLESQAEQAIDRYIESQTEPDIDKYLESQQQQAIDKYIESQAEFGISSARQTTIQNTYIHNQKFFQIIEIYGIKYFYHITHVAHIPSIIEHGILSHNEAHSKGYVQSDISNRNVNALRNKNENIYGLNLHDYVPLYIKVKNPMMFVRNTIDEHLVVLTIKPEILNIKGSLFTNGNAASNRTQYFRNIEKIAQLDWGCLNNNYWNDYEDGKRKKCSEVLVPNQIKLGNIENICCKYPSTKNFIKSIVPDNFKEKIIIDKSLFFNNYN
ncbi:DarT ssDNA thymidine ADP-ribosyltransferase family protein [Candidatus Marinimicrobia bacterium]|nr:DarT ssDNA thymidine ADP-ribosyltransferase family protein [Candidatus Neomarinimicrobiota bacterium]